MGGVFGLLTKDGIMMEKFANIMYRQILQLLHIMRITIVLWIIIRYVTDYISAKFTDFKHPSDKGDAFLCNILLSFSHYVSTLTHRILDSLRNLHSFHMKSVG